MVTDACQQVRIEELEARCRRLERLLGVIEEIDQRMRDTYSLESLLERIVDLAEQIVGAEAGSVLIYDEQLDLLHFHVTYGGTPVHRLQNLSLRLGEGLAGHVAKTGESLLVPDVTRDKRWSHKVDIATGFHTRSIIAVPLCYQGRLLGVLEVLNKTEEKPFTTEDLLVVKVLGDHAARAIHHTQLRVEREAEQRRADRSLRLAAIGQKTADISHYIKEILLTLSSAGEQIEEGLACEDTAPVRAGWEAMQASLQRLQRLVGSMLVFSQERTPARVRCTLNEIVRDVEAHVRRMAKERGVTLALRLENGLPRLRVDREGMVQALMSLVVNALHATEAGGRLTITTHGGPGHNQRLTVSDTGSGLNLAEIRERAVERGIIPAEEATELSQEEVTELIFHPNISTKGHSGTGLGLPVTRKIVTEHGGTVHVRERRGGGLHFTIEMPKN